MKLFCIGFLVLIVTSSCAQEQVTLVSEIKISDNALMATGK